MSFILFNRLELILGLCLEINTRWALVITFPSTKDMVIPKMKTKDKPNNNKDKDKKIIDLEMTSKPKEG